jgi:hypothetical protein
MSFPSDNTRRADSSYHGYPPATGLSRQTSSANAECISTPGSRRVVDTLIPHPESEDSSMVNTPSESFCSPILEFLKTGFSWILFIFSCGFLNLFSKNMTERENDTSGSENTGERPPTEQETGGVDPARIQESENASDSSTLTRQPEHTIDPATTLVNEDGYDTDEGDESETDSSDSDGEVNDSPLIEGADNLLEETSVETRSAKMLVDLLLFNKELLQTDQLFIIEPNADQLQIVLETLCSAPDQQINYFKAKIQEPETAHLVVHALLTMLSRTPISSLILSQILELADEESVLGHDLKYKISTIKSHVRLFKNLNEILFLECLRNFGEAIQPIEENQEKANAIANRLATSFFTQELADTFLSQDNDIKKRFACGFRVLIEHIDDN